MSERKNDSLRKWSRGRSSKVYAGQPDNISERSRCPSPDSQEKRIWSKAEILRLQLQGRKLRGGRRAMENQERPGKVKVAFYQAGYGFVKIPSWLLGQRRHFQGAIWNDPVSTSQEGKERDICVNSLRSPTLHWFTFALTTGIRSLASRWHHLAPWMMPEGNHIPCPVKGYFT